MVPSMIFVGPAEPSTSRVIEGLIGLAGDLVDLVNVDDALYRSTLYSSACSNGDDVLGIHSST